MENSLQNVIKNRRSIYGIGKETVMTDEKLVNMVSEAIRYAPSAFNSQSARVLTLLGNEHEKFWNMTAGILKSIVSADKFQTTEKKLKSFQSGYGTVLFFEDQDTVNKLQQEYPSYEQNFPLWSLQSSGMLQYSIWMLMEDAGYGASLQHYNPLIDDAVKKTWSIPDSWVLLGEMPFGKPLVLPEPKSFLPLDERLKVYK